MENAKKSGTLSCGWVIAPILPSGNKHARSITGPGVTGARRIGLDSLGTFTPQLSHADLRRGMPSEEP